MNDMVNKAYLFALKMVLNTKNATASRMPRDARKAMTEYRPTDMWTSFTCTVLASTGGLPPTGNTEKLVVVDFCLSKKSDMSTFLYMTCNYS